MPEPQTVNGVSFSANVERSKRGLTEVIVRRWKRRVQGGGKVDSEGKQREVSIIR